MTGETTTTAMARILIGEGQGLGTEDIAAILRTLGYEVVGIVSKGEEAIPRAEEVRPDLVLMDINLAGKVDGIEAAEQIYTRFDIPVIYVTGHTEEGLQERAERTQAYGYLAKDATSLELKTTIESALYKHAAVRRLRESEQRYRAIADNANIGIFTSTIDGALLQANPAVARMAGYGSVEEFLTVRAPDLYSNALDRQRFVNDLLSNGAVRDYEILAHKKDGSPQWVSLNAVLQKDHAGNPISILGIVENITDRKKAEEALRESEERYRLLVHLAPDAIVVSQDGRIVYVNRAAMQLLGETDPALVVGTYPITWVHPDDRPLVAHRMKVLLASETLVPPLVWRLSRRDGTVRHVEAVSGSLRSGGSMFIHAVLRDITDRKRAEDALRESQEKYRMIFEHAPLGIMHFDRHGVILDFNDKFAEMIGAPREQIIGFDMPELLKDESMRQAVLDTLGGRISYYEGDYRSVSGEKTTPMRAFYNPVLTTEGRFLGAVGIFEDMTERKQAQEEREELRNQLLQAQKMEAIGTLAGGIAHDFNNLLQVTLGFSELLLGEKTERDQDFADLQKIHKAARSGAELVRSLLTFSRKVEPKFMPLSLNQHVRQLEKLLGRTISKMIDIRLELADDLKRINADPGQIEQIIMNLAVNAKDAMGDQGYLTIRTENVTLDEEYCRLNPEAKPGDSVLLSVSDTGQGIDKQDMLHIFEPFYTTKERGRGTGLGLAMVYGIVKQHGGHLTCDSEVGKGTTFKIYLPAIATQEESLAESLAEVPAFGSETVLLVDDEDLVRELAKRILTRSGYTVLAAANGEEALTLYRRMKGQIHLVILDLMMPTMGGKDCLMQLLTIDPQLKVLIASGYGGDYSTQECVDLGAKGFVAKPFRFKELLKEVRKTLDQS